MRPSLVSTLLMSGLAAAQYGSNVSSSACPSPNGVHMIVARASDEQEGYGIIGIVKDAILSRVPGSTAEFVVYPATLSDYFNSESTGVIAMRALIEAFHTNCPNFPMVLMGYSQGAQVTADSLVGQEDNGFADNSTIDQPISPTDSIFNQTAAVIIMGDPTFNTNETFHVGTANRSALFPRRDVSTFDITGLANRTQSYCDYDDPYCAAGNDLAVHLGYVGEYGAVAENFVVKQIRAWYGNNNIGTIVNVTSTASSTATTAASSGVKPTGTGVKPSGTGPVGTGGVTVTSTATAPGGATPTGPSTPSSTKNAAAGARGGDALKVSGAMVGGLLAWMML